MGDYYGAGGNGRVRVRETYLRDSLAPLLTARASGVAKVDMLLRGLARVDDGGWISPDLSWEHLHDLVRPGSYYGDDRRLKRNWLGDKLERLETLQLISRSTRAGRRSGIQVLCDDRSGDLLDDPGAKSASYATVFGDLFQHRRMVGWGSSEIAAYFAAMIAERYARHDASTKFLNVDRPDGRGIWFRDLSWFEDVELRRPPDHVRVPFSVRTLRRGFTNLRCDGLIATLRVQIDPRTQEPFRSPYGRYIYLNGFSDLRPSGGVSQLELVQWATHNELLRKVG